MFGADSGSPSPPVLFDQTRPSSRWHMPDQHTAHRKKKKTPATQMSTPPIANHRYYGSVAAPRVSVVPPATRPINIGWVRAALYYVGRGCPITYVLPRVSAVVAPLHGHAPLVVVLVLVPGLARPPVEEADRDGGVAPVPLLAGEKERGERGGGEERKRRERERGERERKKERGEREEGEERKRRERERGERKKERERRERERRERGREERKRAEREKEERKREKRGEREREMLLLDMLYYYSKNLVCMYVCLLVCFVLLPAHCAPLPACPLPPPGRPSC